jgi:phage gpG-like protein
MAQISLRLQFAAALQAIEGITSRANDFSPALADIGESLLLSTRGRFDDETSPEGIDWKPLLPKTIKAKQRRIDTGKPYRTRAQANWILKDTFTLRDSITYLVQPTVLKVGTNIEYGIYNQASRPFLGLDDGDRLTISETLSEYLAGN